VTDDVDRIPVGEPQQGFPLCLEDTLCCPVCQFECTHIEVCTVNQLGAFTVVTHRGVDNWKDPIDRWHYGSIVTLRFWCESAHRFEMTLRFHKGSVYVTHTRLEDCADTGDGSYVAPPELRRN
jgi:hypothetical protein